MRHSLRVPIRRRGKGKGGGQFAPGERPLDVDPTVPIELEQPDPIELEGEWPPPPIAEYVLWVYDNGWNVTSATWRNQVKACLVDHVPAALHAQVVKAMAFVGKLSDVMPEDGTYFTLLEDPNTGDEIMSLTRTDHYIE